MTDALHYHDRLRRAFRNAKRSPGALPKGRNSPATAGLRALHRAIVGQRLHRAAPREPALLALPDAADRRSPALRALRWRAAVRAAARSSEPLAPNRLRWDPPADLPAGSDFVDGLVTMIANRDPADLEGVARPSLSRQPLMDGRVFVDADGELLIIPQ